MVKHKKASVIGVSSILYNFNNFSLLTFVCDIYIEKDSKKYAFELKAPLPNSDQTKVSKEKLLKLYSMEETPITDAFLCFTI